MAIPATSQTSDGAAVPIYSLLAFRSERVFEEDVDLRSVSRPEKHCMATVVYKCEIAVYGCISCEAASLLFYIGR